MQIVVLNAQASAGQAYTLRTRFATNVAGTFNSCSKPAEKQPLRIVDALHLASALLLKQRVGSNVFFSSFAERLNKVAEKEGGWPHLAIEKLGFNGPVDDKQGIVPVCILQ
jgi:hypothetical protein